MRQSPKASTVKLRVSFDPTRLPGMLHDLSRPALLAPIPSEGGEAMKTLLMRIVPTVVLLAVPAVVLAAGKAVEMACCAGGACCPNCQFC
jgi:hypothetical protein